MNNRSLHSQKIYPWLIMLCGCCYYGTFLGAIGYTVGNFLLPISQSFSCGLGQVSLYVTLHGLSVGLFIPVARRIVERNMRASLLFSSALIIFCLNMMARIDALWQLFIWCILLGIGNSFLRGATIPALIRKWFHKKSGTVLGICLSAGALAGALLNPALASIIESSSWRSGYIFLSLVVAVLNLPATLFILKDDPHKYGLRPYGEEEGAAEKTESSAELSGVTEKEAFRLAAFYMMVVTTAGFSFIFNLTSHLQTYGKTIGLSMTLASLLTSASLVGGTIGKLTLGMIGDRFGPKAALFTAELSVLAGLALISMGAFYPILLPVGTLFFGYGASTTTILPATMTPHIFGMRDYGSILSWFTTAASLIGGFGNAAYGFLYDVSGSYTLSIFVCALSAVLCLALGSISLRQGKGILKNE